jgi:Short C-terminal domain
VTSTQVVYSLIGGVGIGMAAAAVASPVLAPLKRLAQARKPNQAARDHLRSAAGLKSATAGTTTSAADELLKLEELRAKGVIDDAEYQRLKSRLLA